jgi:hypothetical protein
VGDAVASVGNFDKVLPIDERGRVLPRGILDVDPGHVVRKIYVWVIQVRGEDEGAAAAGFQDSTGLNPADKVWQCRDDVVNDGVFTDGLALGLALAIVEETKTKTDKVRWWTDTVKLQKVKLQKQ